MLNFSNVFYYGSVDQVVAALNHDKVHSQIRRAVPGPASAAAGPDVLERRRDHLLGLL